MCTFTFLVCFWCRECQILLSAPLGWQNDWKKVTFFWGPFWVPGPMDRVDAFWVRKRVSKNVKKWHFFWVFFTHHPYPPLVTKNHIRKPRKEKKVARLSQLGKFEIGCGKIVSEGLIKVGKKCVSKVTHFYVKKWPKIDFQLGWNFIAGRCQKSISGPRHSWHKIEQKCRWRFHLHTTKVDINDWLQPMIVVIQNSTWVMMSLSPMLM